MSCHDRQMDQETGEKQQETRRLRREQRHSTFALVEARHPLTTNIVTETMTVPERKALQSTAAALDVGLSQSDRVRKTGWISVRVCLPNQQQATPWMFLRGSLPVCN